MPASTTPSAKASQRRTARRARVPSGISRLIGETLSRNSTITRESYSAVPSSRTSVGILPSGLCAFTGFSAGWTSTGTSSHSIFFSAATMRTLRVNGLAVEERSFIEGADYTRRALHLRNVHMNALAQLGDDKPRKPGILPDPSLVPPARMRQHKVFGQVFPERAHCFGQGPLFPAFQVVRLGVASDQQSHSDERQGSAKAWLPARRALGPRRQVGAVDRAG